MRASTSRKPHNIDANKMFVSVHFQVAVLRFNALSKLKCKYIAVSIATSRDCRY